MLANKRFSSIEEFYADNEVRRNSPEADYGVWWTSPRDPGYWRVSYIQATGEVYAVLVRGGTVEILGTVSPDTDAVGEVYYRYLNRILKGWADVCGTATSLEWVRRKIELVSITPPEG